MCSDIWTIIQKEASSVFRDKRIILANYILPLLLMPLLFGVITAVQRSQTLTRMETTYPICIENSPGPVFERLLAAEIKYSATLLHGSIEGVTIVFPQEHSRGSKGIIRILSDSTKQDMQFAVEKIKAAINNYNLDLAGQRLSTVGLTQADLQALTINQIDIAPTNAQGTMFIVTMLPYMLLVLIFASSMQLGLSLTVGEKEKGTLVSLLVNQISRSSIALGKSLFVVASGLITAIANVVGMAIAVLIMAFFYSNSVSGLVGDSSSHIGSVIPSGTAFNVIGSLVEPLNLTVFLFALLLASGLSASIIVFVGTRSRTMKEAGGYITPLYLLIIVAGIATMNMDATSNSWLYTIPLVNTIFVIKSAILSTISFWPIFLTFLVNALSATFFTILTAREYNSERILFSE